MALAGAIAFFWKVSSIFRDEYNLVAESEVSTISDLSSESEAAMAACVQHAWIAAGVSPLSTKLPLASGIKSALAGAVVFFWNVASILGALYNALPPPSMILLGDRALRAVSQHVLTIVGVSPLSTKFP